MRREVLKLFFKDTPDVSGKSSPLKITNELDLSIPGVDSESLLDKFEKEDRVLSELSLPLKREPGICGVLEDFLREMDEPNGLS